MICNRCGGENQNIALICSQCGHKLQSKAWENRDNGREIKFRELKNWVLPELNPSRSGLGAGTEAWICAGIFLGAAYLLASLDLGVWLYPLVVLAWLWLRLREV